MPWPSSQLDEGLPSPVRIEAAVGRPLTRANGPGGIPEAVVPDGGKRIEPTSRK